MTDPVLLDVSRLIWRLWRGGQPTGIDRVCLAYVEHLRDRARAVVQRRGRYFVLTPEHSQRAFDLFLRPGSTFRRDLVQLAARAFASKRRPPAIRGLLYINVGHTGLEEPTLTDWVARSGVRAVYLIHDIIPLLHPEYCRAGEQAKHQRRMENVLRSASGLIGNSQATLDDLADFASEHSLPTPPSVAAWIAGHAVPPSIVPRRFERPHFITVGTIEARKNHSLLLQIWKRFAALKSEKTPMLVIVGQRGWEADQAIAMLDRSTDLRGHVLELGSCGDAELAELISGARALLMPSFTEGFGLPVSESLEIGTPVIASDLPVFREFAGAIPTYLDPLDGIAWAAAIDSFTGDSPERQRQLRAIAEYRAPDWYSHFKIVEAWLQTLS